MICGIVKNMQEIENKKKKETLYNLLLLIATLFLILIILELVFRFIYPVSDTLYNWDEFLGYKHISDKSGKVVISEGISKVSFNKEGFRDINHNIANNGNKTRIVFLGDSFVDALQVNFHDTFFEILQKNLNEKYPGKYEVFNFGMSAFSTAQEYLSYENYASKYNSDYVFLLFFINDPYDSCLPDSTKPTYYIENNVVKIRNFTPRYHSNFEIFISNHLKTLVFLRERYYDFRRMIEAKKTMGNKTGKIEFEKIFLKEYDNQTRECWDITSYFINKLDKEIKSKNWKLIIVIVPHPASIYKEDKKRFLQKDTYLPEKDFDFEKPQEKITKILSDNRITFINLEPFFKKSEKRVYFPIDGHFNKQGHELVSQIIFENLINEEKLK